jgi:alcohol dehydrogenase class IV
MSINFEFITPTRILVGEGKALEAGKLAKEYGTLALVLTGISTERINNLLEAIQTSGIELVHYFIDKEPTVEIVQRGVNLGMSYGCELVIAIGGGSVIDAGKAISVLMSNEGDVYDYLEVVGKGKSLLKPGMPLITIPTTAGTGAEVTRNAVIGVPEHKVKVSLRSPHMLAKVAIIDPWLTCSMPKNVTASTGMDALTQLIEPFVSNQANPLTDALCKEGMYRVARSLVNAYQEPEDLDARIDMSLASLMSGLALANAKLGVVHGFASVLGGMLNAPHGAICARLLPPSMAINVAAIQNRAKSEETLARFNQVAQILTGHPDASASDGVAWIEILGDTLEIPSLSQYGLSQDDFQVVIEKTSVASSTKGNPITLSVDEMAAILARAL